MTQFLLKVNNKIHLVDVTYFKWLNNVILNITSVICFGPFITGVFLRQNFSGYCEIHRV